MALYIAHWRLFKRRIAHRFFSLQSSGSFQRLPVVFVLRAWQFQEAEPSPWRSGYLHVAAVENLENCVFFHEIPIFHPDSSHSIHKYTWNILNLQMASSAAKDKTVTHTFNVYRKPWSSPWNMKYPGITKKGHIPEDIVVVFDPCQFFVHATGF